MRVAKIGALLWVVWVTACGAGSTRASQAPAVAGADAVSDPGSVDYVALVAADDRSDADRALDAGRKPTQTLNFMGVRPGMRAGEIAAGSGYTTELLARAVGPTGHVYAVNSPWVLERFAQQPWTERLTKPVMAQVTRLDREFDEPFPPEIAGLDLVVNVLFYHDTFWMELDREAMNRAIFAALRAGGAYVVIDHSARDRMSDSETKSLHRVGEQRVRKEIEQAGFRFEASADFLRNPDDGRDWSASPGQAGARRGTSDRFVMKFVKPCERCRKHAAAGS